MQCTKCGTALKDDKVVVHWIDLKSSSIEDESKTYIFCPTCYEEEATNAI